MPYAHGAAGGRDADRAAYEGFHDARVLHPRPLRPPRRGGPPPLPARAGRRRPAADHAGERPAGAGAVGRIRRQPADGAGDGQPDLAAPLRRGDRPDAQQLRQARHAADPPGVARLAGADPSSWSRGWSIKAMHRLIMLSAAYQQSSVPDAGDAPGRPGQPPAAAACTAAGWRRRRSATACSPWPAGSTTTRGGPAFEDIAIPRRTIYLRTVRSDRSSFRIALRRRRPAAHRRAAGDSTVAPQALFLMNDPFVVGAGHGAGRACASAARRAIATRIDWLYQHCLARPANGREIEIGLAAPAPARDTAPAEVAWEVLSRCCSARTNSSTSIDGIDPSAEPQPWRLSCGRDIPGCLQPPPDAADVRQRLRHARRRRPAVADGRVPRSRRGGWYPSADQLQSARPSSRPMFPARAKRVIFLFMSGGPSHVDTFDPKPRLTLTTASRCRSRSPSWCGPRRQLLASPWKFAKHGQSRHRGQRAASRTSPACVDDLCVDPLDGRRQHQPHRRLPADEHRRAGVPPAEPGLVADLRPGQREPEPARFRRRSAPPSRQGRALWSSSFLPAAYQGTLVSDLKNPIGNLKNPDLRPPAAARGARHAHGSSTSGIYDRTARRTAGSAPGSSRFELAFRMQAQAPEAFDLGRRVARDAQSSTASATTRPTSSAASA